MFSLLWRKSLAFLVLALSIVAISANRTNADTSLPIVILADLQKNKSQYTIEEMQIKPANMENCLIKLIRSKGRDNPVVVILYPESHISYLNNLRGLLQKVGFLNIRYFFTGDDKRMMAELVLDKPAVPFSADPEILKKLY